MVLGVPIFKHIRVNLLMNAPGWMDDFDFMSFSTVFQSYQDNGQVIKGCMQWNPVYDLKNPASGRA